MSDFDRIRRKMYFSSLLNVLLVHIELKRNLKKKKCDFRVHKKNLMNDEY